MRGSFSLLLVAWDLVQLQKDKIFEISIFKGKKGAYLIKIDETFANDFNSILHILLRNDERRRETHAKKKEKQKRTIRNCSKKETIKQKRTQTY